MKFELKIWKKKIFSFEDTSENAKWRKDKKMQALWLCILSGRRFEEIFKNAHWRKVKQMQPVPLCILSGKRFEETYEEAQSSVESYH